MLRLSLKAHGLKTFLHSPRTVEDIKNFTTDTPNIIGEVLRELQKKKLLNSYEESGTIYYICSEPQSDKIAAQERRIENLFYKIRPYYIISWWFSEEGYFYPDDESLKSAVELEYEHARTVQFFDDQFLQMGYEEYKKVVPQNRTLGGLFEYATRARGY